MLKLKILQNRDRARYKLSLPSPGKYLENRWASWEIQKMAFSWAESTETEFCKLYAAVPALLNTSLALTKLIHTWKDLEWAWDNPFSSLRLRETRELERERKDLAKIKEIWSKGCPRLWDSLKGVKKDF